MLCAGSRSGSAEVRSRGFEKGRVVCGSAMGDGSKPTGVVGCLVKVDLVVGREATSRD